MKRRHHRHRGFTVVELLIVIVVIVVLAAILFPVFLSARARAKETSCISNLRQIGMAFQMYMSDYRYRPPRLHSLHPQYVTDKQLFVCPADEWTSKGGWAWAYWGVRNTPPEKWPFPISYGYFFFRSTGEHDRDWEWAQSAPGRPGYAVCVLHGKPYEPEFTEPDKAHYYSGRILRLCFDGSVIVRNDPGKFHAWRLMTDQKKAPNEP